MRLPGAALAVSLGGVMLGPPPLRAQESPTIQAAVRLAASGQGDSARSLVARQLERSRPGDSAYVEALYWSGRLAVTGEDAENDFRRVAIEYSNSRWADRALLQLAELALAAGNGAGALQLGERLRNDYPTSPLRPQAALWAGRAAFDVGNPVTACALLDSARAEAPGDIEFLNRVAFYRQRCVSVAMPPPADTSPAAAPGAGGGAATAAPPRPPSADTGRRVAPAAAAPAAPAPRFEVQVGASRSSRTASTLLARVRRAGEPGHVVVERSGLRRVRAGPYATERAATEAAARLKRLLGGHPFVVPAP